jgi:ElaB/YqjD/DUF883 family membrane-anchored ribosome-binding protein
LASKQDGTKPDLEDTIKELRKDFDTRLEEMRKELQRDLKQSYKQGRRAVREGEESLGDLRDDLEERMQVARTQVQDTYENTEQLIREHPVLVVGGALAVGILLGHLLGSKNRD